VRGGHSGGFLFSGAVHDLVISARPVAATVGRRRSSPFKAWRCSRNAALPVVELDWPRRARLGLHDDRARRDVGLLFHRPFVLRIIVPFLHAIGALP